jgi:tRNA(adenine34) deaminase
LSSIEQDEFWMRRALELAAEAEALGEVPVGAVIVLDGEVIGEGFNQPISSCDPSAHAEIVAVRAAAKSANNYRLPGSSIYVTLEPCTMCVGALIHARIERLVYGTTEPKSGAVISRSQLLTADYFNHRIEVTGGILAEECQHQLSQFFQKRRDEKRQQRENPDV